MHAKFVVAILPEDPVAANDIRSPIKVFGGARGRVDAPLDPGGDGPGVASGDNPATEPAPDDASA